MNFESTAFIGGLHTSHIKHYSVITGRARFIYLSWMILSCMTNALVSSSDENINYRLHPSGPPKHNQMSIQSAYICMVARHINNDRADGFQVHHLCKRSTIANGTIGGFFIPVSSLGETCDGLVRTVRHSIYHRNRLLLSMDREKTY